MVSWRITMLDDKKADKITKSMEEALKNLKETNARLKAIEIKAEKGGKAKGEK
jgi:hypothetical protein